MYEATHAHIDLILYNNTESYCSGLSAIVCISLLVP